MQFLKAIFATALFLAATSANANADTAIDRLLDSSGLSTLTPNERTAARALVRRLLARNAQSATLTDSAVEYMRNEGFEPVHLEVTSVDGRTFLLARTGFATYATADVPITLNRFAFRSGEYFAKRSIILGGVSEFIDGDGNRQSLLFADWFEVN